MPCKRPGIDDDIIGCFGLDGQPHAWHAASGRTSRVVGISPVLTRTSLMLQLLTVMAPPLPPVRGTLMLVRSTLPLLVRVSVRLSSTSGAQTKGLRR